MPRFQTSDGLSMAYEIQGTGTIPAVFLHGWGGSAAWWRELIAAVDSSVIQSVAIDWRGHGDSEGNGRFSHERLAADVLELIDHLRLGPIIIVGHSFGARMAQLVSHRYPDRVWRQVLLAGYPLTGVPTPGEQQQFMISCGGNPAQMRLLAQSLIHREVSDRILDAVVESSCRASRAALQAVLELCASPVPVSAPSRVPALVVAGDQDAVCPPAFIQEQVLTALDDYTYVSLPCGHLIPLEMPVQTGDLIMTLVKPHGAPGVP